VGSLLETVQVGHHVSDSPAIKPEPGHGAVTRDDALRERFSEILKRVVAPIEVAERWRESHRACPGPADCVALGTVGLHEGAPALNRRRREAKKGGSNPEHEVYSKVRGSLTRSTDPWSRRLGGLDEAAQKACGGSGAMLRFSDFSLSHTAC
jgi:hypothetical protein